LGRRIWEVVFADAFDPKFDALAEEVQDELLAQLHVIR